jgi:conjugal transfer pilus assembly protein TraA
MLSPPSLSGRDRRTLLFAGIAATPVVMAISATATAGTTGTEFSALYTLLTGWMTGFLGRVVAVIFIIIGVIAGAARQSIMGFVLGIAAGVGMFLAPAIVDGVVTATLPVL